MGVVTEYLVALLTLSALIWAGVEGVGRVLNIKKDRLSLILGILLGVLARGAGFLPDPDPQASIVWDYLLAGLLGLLSAFGAQLAHEYGVKAALGQRTEKKP